MKQSWGTATQASNPLPGEAPGPVVAPARGNTSRPLAPACRPDFAPDSPPGSPRRRQIAQPSFPPPTSVRHWEHPLFAFTYQLFLFFFF